LQVIQLEKDFTAGHPANGFGIGEGREVDLVADASSCFFNIEKSQHGANLE
jgi:hypothetical protein